MDLHDLLPEALRESQFSKTRENKDEKDKKKKFLISTPLDWAVAFATYTGVAVHCKPERAFKLAAFASIVLNLLYKMEDKGDYDLLCSSNNLVSVMDRGLLLESSQKCKHLAPNNTTNNVTNMFGSNKWTRCYKAARLSLTETRGLSQFVRPQFVTLLFQDSAKVVEIFALFFQKNVHQLIDLLYMSFLLSDAVVLHVVKES